MAKDTMVNKLYERKPISTGLTGRPKIRWQYELKERIRLMKISN
jgi:hypothetical protein